MNFDFDFFWKQIKNGDEQALEKVYKAAFRSLVYYAKEITGQHHLAEEVVQDVFLKIWQNRSELAIKGSFKAYLFQSVHNQSLNTIRQQKTRKESVNLMTTDRTWQFISDNYKIEENLIDSIFSSETESIIDKIIQELPDQCRKVFIMSRLESLKNSEIAVKLGISENTVKTHICKALQKIASGLKKEK
jgi:RNA polymerase sigma-70 factor (ECF subfamily)